MAHLLPFETQDPWALHTLLRSSVSVAGVPDFGKGFCKHLLANPARGVGNAKQDERHEDGAKAEEHQGILFKRGETRLLFRANSEPTVKLAATLAATLALIHVIPPPPPLPSCALPATTSPARSERTGWAPPRAAGKPPPVNENTYQAT